MAAANLLLRFVLEVAGFAGAAYVVYQLADGWNGILRLALAIVGGVAVIVLWGFVAAPRRENGLTQAQKDVIGTVILLVVAIAMAWVGQGGLAILFGILILANAVLLFVFGQEARAQFDRRR